jgi:hypothetical protein
MTTTEKLKNVLCFALGVAACSFTALGVLGVNPFVSSNTNKVCQDVKLASIPCKPF